ncbi:hypothetical protein TRVL_10292 [Trypanosoma vivax]|nr:hypothetical protein TRVL_10292 [Trypanosoma vivax]
MLNDHTPGFIAQLAHRSTPLHARDKKRANVPAHSSLHNGTPDNSIVKLGNPCVWCPAPPRMSKLAPSKDVAHDAPVGTCRGRPAECPVGQRHARMVRCGSTEQKQKQQISMATPERLLTSGRLFVLQYCRLKCTFCRSACCRSWRERGDFCCSFVFIVVVVSKCSRCTLSFRNE